MAEKSSSIETPVNGQEVEDDESNAITMVDVLKEETELEEDANAVLGASDPLNCTYPQGYVKRQALYACITCIPADSDKERGGVCLACSYSCHENHDLVELYTKRNFRCDCGNSKFGGNKCNLEPVKEENDKNKYNQNFKGVYCTCKRPYPDPEDTNDDEMIQCIMCEDWYHGRHLGVNNAIPKDYGEMVCEQCMSKHPFLWNYAGLCLTKGTASEQEVDVDLKQTAVSDDSAPSTPTILINGSAGIELNTPGSSQKSNVETPIHDGKECILSNFKPVEQCKGATFWPEGWRKQLCLCPKCLDNYEASAVSYLTDLQDTVQFYEEQGKAKAANGQASSQYDHAMHALSQMDRTAQIEAIHGYNDMKDQLKEYLQKFAESRKVVREEDIREFFSQMARKRPRIEVPSFCR
ncbi:Putative E3 ubiquitin-protein ligase [Frankliniella fusca]|uniref:Putative E3 ubiquitin-protein ligase UBR7 n=1 Tax=Frankliniella fusca TaxID=407009 RepID=A0AAE1HBF2_9NEOP|nr:Putative E3 ubiquitin-protein ligase [Frankliniella fusca]